MGYVEGPDLLEAARLPDVTEEEPLAADWAAIPGV